MDISDRRVLRRKSFLLEKSFDSSNKGLETLKHQGLINKKEYADLKKHGPRERSAHLLGILESNPGLSVSKVAFIFTKMNLDWISDELIAEKDLEDGKLRIEDYIIKEAELVVNRHVPDELNLTEKAKEELIMTIAGKVQVAKHTWKSQATKKENALGNEIGSFHQDLMEVHQNLHGFMDNIDGISGEVDEADDVTIAGSNFDIENGDVSPFYPEDMDIYNQSQQSVAVLLNGGFPDELNGTSAVPLQDSMRDSRNSQSMASRNRNQMSGSTLELQENKQQRAFSNQSNSSQIISRPSSNQASLSMHGLVNHNSSEHSANQTNSNVLTPTDPNTSQLDSNQTYSIDSNSIKTQPTQSISNQMNSNQPHSNKMNLTQPQTNQMNSNQPHTNQMNSNQPHTNEMNSNQPPTNQMNSNQVDFNQTYFPNSNQERHLGSNNEELGRPISKEMLFPVHFDQQMSNYISMTMPIQGKVTFHMQHHSDGHRNGALIQNMEIMHQPDHQPSEQTDIYPINIQQNNLNTEEMTSDFSGVLAGQVAELNETEKPPQKFNSNEHMNGEDNSQSIQNQNNESTPPEDHQNSTRDKLDKDDAQHQRHVRFSSPPQQQNSSGRNSKTPTEQSTNGNQRNLAKTGEPVQNNDHITEARAIRQNDVHKFGSTISQLSNKVENVLKEQQEMKAERERLLAILEIPPNVENAEVVLKNKMRKMTEELHEAKQEASDNQGLATTMSEKLKENRQLNEKLHGKNKELEENHHDKSDDMARKLTAEQRNAEAKQSEVEYWKNRCDILEKTRRLGYYYLSWWENNRLTNKKTVSREEESIMKLSPKTLLMYDPDMLEFKDGNVYVKEEPLKVALPKVLAEKTKTLGTSSTSRDTSRLTPDIDASSLMRASTSAEVRIRRRKVNENVHPGLKKSLTFTAGELGRDQSPGRKGSPLLSRPPQSPARVSSSQSRPDSRITSLTDLQGMAVKEAIGNEKINDFCRCVPRCVDRVEHETKYGKK